MIIWSLYLLQVYMTIKQPTYRHILFLIATGVFMIGLRHIGIILVFTTGLFLWYHLRKSPFYLMVILNFFLPLVIFFLWQYFLYNYMGHLSRLDHFSDADIINSSIQVGVHFTRWFLPLSGIVFIDTSLALITISFLVLLIRLGVRQQQNKVFFHFLIVLILIFLAFITLKGDLIYSDIERYLSIIYLPTLLLVVNGLQQFQKEYQMNQKLLVTLSLIWCIYPLIRLTNNVILWAGI